MYSIVYMLLALCLVAPVVHAESGIGHQLLNIRKILIGNKGLNELACVPSPNICDDLYQQTCADESVDDGTGTATSLNPAGKAYEDYERLIQKPLFDKIKEAFDDSDFKKASIRSFSSSRLPACKSNNTNQMSQTKECTDEAINLISKIILRHRYAEDNWKGRFYFNANEHGPFLNQKKYLEIEEWERKEFVNFVDKTSSANKVEDVFIGVKKEIIKKIKSLTSEPATSKLVRRISDIKLSDEHCKGWIQSEVENVDAIYYKDSNSIKICKGYLLKASSAFSLSSILAHEISHSIDPCNIAFGADTKITYSNPADNEESKKQYPVKNILTCLRGQNSARAIRFDDSGRGYLNYDQSKTQAVHISPFCQSDQINESFADWLAAEVVPEYIQQNFPQLTELQYKKGYSNLRKVHCDVLKYEDVDDKVHPAEYRRLNYIYLVHPKIRDQMGCTEPPVYGEYCSPTKVD